MTDKKVVNKLLACLMAIMIVLAYMPAAAQGAFAKSAEGTAEDPIKIETVDDLVAVANSVNEGTPSKGVYYELAADIAIEPVDMQKEQIDIIKLAGDQGELIWVAIGNDEHPFAGNFDGKGHVITGLNGEQGLFGHVEGATISNVTVSGEAEPAEETSDVAGLVGCVCEPAEGEAKTVIENVGNYVDVTVKGSGSGTTATGHNVAGIVGHVDAGAVVEIKTAFNKGEISGYENVGGIVGRNEGTLTVTTAYNGGTVTATHSNLDRNTTALAGGICSNACTVNNVYNTGKVTGYYRGGGGSTSARGYAIASGNPTVKNFYWLQGSAQRSYGNNTSGYSTEANFTNGTVLKGLNDFFEETTPWIEGDKVKVPEGADAQKYPGLAFEIKGVDELKALAISKLEAYADPDDYGEAQQEVLAGEVATGKDAINEAEDDLGIDGALNDAEMAINDIPTLSDISDAKTDLNNYIRGKNYNEAQLEEIMAIIRATEDEFDAALSNQAITEFANKAKEAIDNIPTSGEVEKAEEAKKGLRETVVYANNIMSSGEYSAKTLGVLKEAISAAKNVYGNGDAFEADVKAAQESVWAALLDLEVGNDGAKSTLLETMIAAQKISGSSYTKASFNALQKAISDANTLVADPDAAVEALRDANVAILKAQNGLTPKKPNTMTVKTKKTTVKYKAVKKKNKVVKAITVSNAKGSVSYAKKSGSGKFTVNKKNGKITIKKGIKKGSYTVKVTVNASGNDNYKSASAVAAVVIIIK